MPAGWDTGALTFQAAGDGVAASVANMYDSDGNEINVAASAGIFIALSPAAFAGVRHLKIRSGTAASAVTQSAERKITLLVRTV